MPFSADSTVRSHERSVLAAYWALYPIATIIVALRFYARVTRSGLGLDDWTMLSAWLFYTALAGLNTVLTRRGVQDHIGNIEPDTLVWISRAVYVSQGLASIGITLSRAAVGFFLLRIMKGRYLRWQRYIIYLHTGLVIVIAVPTTVMLFLQCDPPKALWDHSLIVEGQATCPRIHVELALAMLQAAFGAYTDYVLALLPLTFILKLQMPTGRKIAICCLLGLGVLAGALGTARTFMFINGFDSEDPTFNSYRLFVLGILEIELMIIAGSVAPSKPLFDRMFKKQTVEITPVFQAPQHSEQDSKNTWLLAHPYSKRSTTVSKLDSSDQNSNASIESQQGFGTPTENSIRVTKQVLVSHNQ